MDIPKDRKINIRVSGTETLNGWHEALHESGTFCFKYRGESYGVRVNKVSEWSEIEEKRAK